jgi:hypothetical protein
MQWISIGLCLKDFGFDVCYNMSGINNNEFKHQIKSHGLNYSLIPSHLNPLLGTLAGLVIGRLGGGFDILTIFGKPKKTILLLLDAGHVNGKIQDHHSVKSAYWHFEKFGLKIDDIIKLHRDESLETLQSKLKSSLIKIF